MVMLEHGNTINGTKIQIIKLATYLMHFYCIERKQVDDGHGIVNWLTDWLAGRLPGWHKTYHYSCPAGVTQSSVYERHTLQVSHFSSCSHTWYTAA